MTMFALRKVAYSVPVKWYTNTTKHCVRELMRSSNVDFMNPHRYQGEEYGCPEVEQSRAGLSVRIDCHS